MIKLCIFDLDGTLLDTIGTIAYHGNHALTKNGFKEINVNQYKYLAGKGARNLVKNMLNYSKIPVALYFEKVYADYISSYNSAPLYGTNMFEGMKETLDTMKQNGIKLAVLSNKPDNAVQTNIAHFFGNGYFDVIQGQKDNIPLKPDPYSVNIMLKQTSTKKEEVFFIGDTAVDMETGKNSGLKSVGVLWGFRDEKELKESGADIIIKKPCELLNYTQERL